MSHTTAHVQARGHDELRRGLRARHLNMIAIGGAIGTGLFVAAGSALIPMALGSPALRTWHTYVEVPLIGKVHLVSSLLFDVGVYLVVLGLMLDILRSLGSGIDEQISRERQREGVGP